MSHAQDSPPLFAEPTMWHSIRAHVVPYLRTYPTVRVWIAGGAMAGAAYSAAIVLREEGLLGRSRIFGTDADADAIRRARSGRCGRAAIGRAGDAYHHAGGIATLDEYYREDDEGVSMRPLLSERLSFFQHDLSADASFLEFQLVLCGTELAAHAFETVSQSICPLGFLGTVGESSFPNDGRRSRRYERVHRAVSLYRRMR